MDIDIDSRQFVLVVLGDGVFGPFPTGQAADEFAREYYGTPEDYAHADGNADFYVVALVSADDYRAATSRPWGS